MSSVTVNQTRSSGMTSEERMVIFASSLGTVFEWYDFYIYGTLGADPGAVSSPASIRRRPSSSRLLAFAAGFAVRPFGALFFGRLGDIIGRKYTFLITMTLMGVGTFFIGVLPSYASAGIIAPIILIGCAWRKALRSAANMAARRSTSPNMRRRTSAACYTSWIQTTATLGLFMALLLVLGIRTSQGEADLRRLGLAHSVPAVGDPARGLDLDPAEAQEVADVPADEGEGKQSKRPLGEAFGNWATPRSRSSRCSAPPPVKPSSGTADSSTRCSSSP